MAVRVVGLLNALVLVAGLALAGGAVGGLRGAGPLYVALGDSVAAGVGASPPDDGGAGRGYVPALAALLRDGGSCGEAGPRGCDLRVRNLAVGGATSATLIAEQLPRAVELLRREGSAVRLVTLTVGGNDLLPVVEDCARAGLDQRCGRELQRALALLDAGLGRVLAELRDAAAPGTVLAVSTYYNSVGSCRFAAVAPQVDVVLEGGEGVPEGVNDVVRRRAAQVGAVVVELPGRLGPDDYVGGEDCVHPDDSGHAAIAAAFHDAVAALSPG